MVGQRDGREEVCRMGSAAVMLLTRGWVQREGCQTYTIEQPVASGKAVSQRVGNTSEHDLHCFGET